jgi:hypothetical protein
MILVFLSLCWLAGTGLAPNARAQAEETPKVSFSGHYHVKGVTVEKQTGAKRDLSGTVILVQEGNAYTSTFDLETQFPTVNGAVQAQVIGKGEGTVEGRTATGKARTQIILSQLPNVDPGFAFVPAKGSKRIVSNSVATLLDDGSVEIQIESVGEKGEKYVPTRTTLTGIRAHDAESERWGKQAD